VQRLYWAYLSFAFLILLILSQETHYPDKGILACLYIIVFALSIHYGRNLSQYKENLLAGIYWSAIILALTGILGWMDIIIHSHPQSLGMGGILGQKNLFANWIACGIIAGLWIRGNKYVIIALVGILCISGSKIALLYLSLIWWVWKKRPING
jgi:hypothetical protein